MTLKIYEELEQGTAIARFSKYYERDAQTNCWEWQSTISNRGYGKFWLSGKKDLAHRASYKLHKGPIPEGFVVRHTCDNPRCVNPDHLLVGTGRDNVQDAVDRGLVPRGTDNGRAKLTLDQVREIRDCRKRGDTQASLARRFGVSVSAVQWILNGRNWAGMGEES